MLRNDVGTNQPTNGAPPGPGEGGVTPSTHPRHPAHAAPSQPHGLSAAPSAVALLTALRRRWLLASTLSVACAGAVAAGVWFFLPPPKNTATAQLRLKMDDHGKVFKHPDEVADFANYQMTQAALVRSRLVLNAALNQSGVAGLETFKKITPTDPVEWLEKELKVDFRESRELMRVSLSGDYTEELKKIVDAVTEAYLSEIVDAQKGRRAKRLEELRKLQQQYQDLFDRKQAAIRAKAEASQAADAKEFDAKAAVVEDLLGSARRDLMKVESDLLRLKIEKSLYTTPGGVPAKIPARVVDGHVEKDEVVQKLQKEQDNLKLALEQAIDRSRDGRDSPKARQASRSLDENRKALEARKKEIRPQVEARLRESLQTDAKDGQAHVETQITLQNRYRDELKKEIEKLAAMRGQAVGGKLDMRALEADLARYEDVLKIVGMEVTRLEVELDTKARVEAFQPAVGYEANPTARKMKLAGAGGGGVLALILGMIAFLEFRVRRIGSVEEVSHGLGLPVVGTLPAYPTTASGEGHWHRLVAEAADATRTMLLHKGRAGNMQVVMVTSAVGGEGKTSLSGHLAVSLARAGRGTLLIDCDLRNPSCHAVFGAAEAPGVCEVLRGEATLDEAVQSAEAPGLSLLTAGRCDASALQMLALGSMRQLLDQLRQRFAFIIVDTSPILPVADALLVAQEVDGVIFSVLRDVSRMPNVHAAQQRLYNLGVNLLGAVVSGTRADVYGYGPRLLDLAANSPTTAPETIASERAS